MPGPKMDFQGETTEEEDIEETKEEQDKKENTPTPPKKMKKKVKTRKSKRLEGLSENQLKNLIRRQDDEIIQLTKDLSAGSKKAVVNMRRIKTLQIQLHNESSARQKWEADKTKLLKQIDDLKSTHKSQMDDKDERLKDLNSVNETFQDEIRELNEMLQHEKEVAQTLLNTCTEVNKKVTSKPRVLVIDDIHRDSIVARLPSDETWKVFALDTTFSLSGLDGSEAFRKACNTAGQVTYMTGINDLMKPNAQIKHTVSNLLASCSKVDKAKVLISTIPPTKLPETFSKVRILNSMLLSEMEKKGFKLINTQQNLSTLPMSKVVTGDGITLTSLAVDTIIQSLVQISTDEIVAMDLSSDEPMPPSEDHGSTSNHSTLVEVPTEFMKHIIGRRRVMITSIEKETQTRTSVKKWEDQEGRKEGLEIFGSPDAIQEAVRRIESVITDRKKREANKICSFFKSGTCFKGNQCPNIHSSTPNQDRGTPRMDNTKVIKLK